jgi:hypothetical protein
MLESKADGGRDKGIRQLSQLESELQKSLCSMQSPLQYIDSNILKVFCSEVCGSSSLTHWHKHATINFFQYVWGISEKKEFGTEIDSCFD